jgi:cbb3-type cytochrome oxidase maturation protein
MSIIYFLIGCSVFLALAFLIAFFWAQQSGQNDDLYTPGMRILLDETEEKAPEK